MALSLLARVRGRLRRSLANRSFQRRIVIAPRQPIVSFTFDDFPRSALWEAGAVLRSHDWFGTYYASFGLMGTKAPTGEIFKQEDLSELIRQGHEVGCHTFDHSHAWDTPPVEFENSILHNHRTAEELLADTELHTFSYPVSGPRPANKQCIAKYYSCARGGGQTYNINSVDLNLLQAFFIEQSRDDVAAIKRLIDETVALNGWLIFATHDVAPSPTRFGCTPGLFREIAGHVAQSGAAVLPVWNALQSLQSTHAANIISQH